MSGVMHWYVAIVTIVSVLACIWLIIWSSKQSDDRAPEQALDHVWDGDLRELNNPLPRWWLYLFYITILSALVYLVLYPGLGKFAGTLGWTQESQYDLEIQKASDRYEPLYTELAAMDAVALAGNPRALKLGRSLFNNYCTTCHGSDARGAVGYPNLADRDWLYGGTPDAIEFTLTHGRRGVMPALGGVFDDAGLDELVGVISKLKEDGGNIEHAQFQTMCAACHGADGRGNIALGAPNLRDDIWLYGGSVEAISESIDQGRNGIMPPHGNLLGAARTHILAAYVYSLSQDNGRSGN